MTEKQIGIREPVPYPIPRCKIRLDKDMRKRMRNTQPQHAKGGVPSVLEGLLWQLCAWGEIREGVEAELVPMS